MSHAIKFEKVTSIDPCLLLEVNPGEHFKLNYVNQSVSLLRLIKIDLKDDSSSASSESAGLQTGGEEEDGLLHLFDRHRQRGAGQAW